MQAKALVILVVVIRLGLGGLFVYAGIQKFIPKPPRVQTERTVTDPNLAKIKSFIGGMKQTGYFWPMLGIAELTAGLLLLSQAFSLLGAVILVPMTLNIFLFHLFLKPDDLADLALTGLYLGGNLFLLAYAYHPLKNTFLNLKPISL